MADDQASGKGNPLEEYKELCNNMRHYGNMRFGQLTIFVALMGALFAFVSRNGTMCQQTTTLLQVATVVMGAAFWVMEERGADYWHHFKYKARQIEKRLGYEQHKESPPEAIPEFTATNAARVLYVAIPWFLIRTVDSRSSAFADGIPPTAIWLAFAAIYLVFIFRRIHKINASREKQGCRDGC